MSFGRVLPMTSVSKHDARYLKHSILHGIVPNNLIIIVVNYVYYIASLSQNTIIEHQKICNRIKHQKLQTCFGMIA